MYNQNITIILYYVIMKNIFCYISYIKKQTKINCFTLKMFNIKH